MRIDNRRTQLILLSILFLLVNSFNVYHYGIKVVNDSVRYVEYATNLRKGILFDDFNFWYVGYALYVALFQSISTGFEALIVSQYVLAFLAVFALYFASLNILKKNIAAFSTCLLFTIFIDIAQWNSYVLTESLYTSFICFSVYCLSLCYSKKKSPWIIVLTAVVIIYTFFIKPTGIALLGATAFVVLYELIASVRSKAVKVAIGVVVSLLFLMLVNRMLDRYLVMENYQKGEIIYAVTTLPELSSYNLLVIDPPDQLYTPSDEYPPIVKIVGFMVHHPVYWLELFLAKLFYFFVHVRPYWSVFHNLYAVGILMPCYYFFIVAIRKSTVNAQIKLFAIAYLILHALSIGITSEDWDGRFLMPVLPVVMLLGGEGIFLKIFKKSFTQQSII